MVFQFDPPTLYESAEFSIRPQKLSDNPSDHLAVLANQDWLRRWSGSDWPNGSFSIDDNLEDLRGHIDEHQKREAFGFAIATRNDADILGSIYVQEISDWLDDYSASSEVRAALAGANARVDMWSRPDREPTMSSIATQVRAWFDEAWPLSVIFCCRLNCPELLTAYTDAGLAECTRLVHPKSGRTHILFR